MCCSHKLQDEDTGEVLLTNVACSLFDAQTCRCSDYANRSRLVPECVKLTPDNVRSLCRMLPPTCAYRRRAYGRPLPGWHPLVTGDPRSTMRAGMSARDRFLTLRELKKPFKIAPRKGNAPSLG